ncbi:transglycosylase domain-containing protein [Cryomorphaceae bacterium 1068]|nr:transglycosylase domain-containing protein [Cryomorphaceae bacterium 1068]
MAKKSTPKPRKSPTKKKKSKSKSNWKRRIIKFSLFAFFGVLLLLFLLFGAVYIGLFGPLPSKADLTGIKQENASEIYSSDGELLGKYFIKNRSSISFGEIPQNAIDALVATEDSRFFEHEGIDFYSIPRVVIKTIILGDRSGGGGSTISQQLIKNLFGRADHGALSMPVNKLKENITALKLEDIYSKEEIITLYLNTVSFGENVYGIKAAAQRYFDKTPDELELTEAATLIGMLKANTSYNPRLYPEASKERRNVVLALMVREGSLPPDELIQLQAEPIKLDYQKLEGQYGPAPYLRDFLKPKITKVLESTDRGDGKPYNLYSDGLKISLSIDSRLQANAEVAVKKQMRRIQADFDTHWKGKKPWGNDESFLWNEAKKSIRYKRLSNAGLAEKEIKEIFSTPTRLNVFTFDGYQSKTMSPLDSIAYHQMILQAGFMAMNAKTGDILAYVGGIDFGHFPYDHITSHRQVGSTFKPFVYAAALEAGIRPCDYFENEPIIFSNYDDWSPQNSGGPEGGFYTVKGGLAKSVNTIVARLIAEIGPDAARNLAQRLGIRSDLPDGPSIALGVADLSLLEMVPAYSAFANEGILSEPNFILKIETADGKTLFQSKPKKGEKALDYDVAATMREMLELVVDSGTARSLRSVYEIKTDIGGKTGTTQNNADGWFMSITPNMVCGAWVGGQSPLVRFRSTRLGQGAATALPIVGEFIKSSESVKTTKPLVGTRFPDTDADVLLDMLCPIYVENRTEHFLEDLFDKESRQERRELRQQARQEELQEEYEEKEEKKGWMNRLLDKLSKKKK